METKVNGLTVKCDSVLEGVTKNESKLSAIEDEHDELLKTGNRQP